jgi:hypothetical protein
MTIRTDEIVIQTINGEGQSQDLDLDVQGGRKAYFGNDVVDRVGIVDVENVANSESHKSRKHRG